MRLVPWPSVLFFSRPRSVLSSFISVLCPMTLHCSKSVKREVISTIQTCQLHSKHGKQAAAWLTGGRSNLPNDAASVCVLSTAICTSHTRASIAWLGGCTVVMYTLLACSDGAVLRQVVLQTDRQWCSQTDTDPQPNDPPTHSLTVDTPHYTEP